jgi:hypothetical protein
MCWELLRALVSACPQATLTTCRSNTATSLSGSLAISHKVFDTSGRFPSARLRDVRLSRIGSVVAFMGTTVIPQC